MFMCEGDLDRAWIALIMQKLLYAVTTVILQYKAPGVLKLQLVCLREISAARAVHDQIHFYSTFDCCI